MNERRMLILSLPQSEREPLSWLVWSCSQRCILVQGEGDLPTVREAIAGYLSLPTRVLVPTCDVSLHRVTLPKLRSAKLRAALPWLLEERLATDVESLHFALLRQQGDRGVVAVVNKATLSDWLARCHQLAVTPTALLPDCYALPQDAEALSLFQIAGQWLCLDNEGGGMAADENWFDMVLEQWPASQPIDCYSPVPARYANWRAQPPRSLMQLAAERDLLPTENLLPSVPHSGWLPIVLASRWRPLAGVSAGAGILLLINALLAHWQLWHQADWWHQQPRLVYQHLFPDTRPADDPRQQMMMRLTQAKLGNDELTLPFTSAIVQLQRVVDATPGIHITALSWAAARRELQIGVKATKAADLEALQQRAASVFQVQLKEVTAGMDSVQGTLTLRGRP